MMTASSIEISAALKIIISVKSLLPFNAMCVQPRSLQYFRRSPDWRRASLKKLKDCLGDRGLRVVDLIKTRASLLTDLQKELSPFVEDPIEFDMGAVKRILSLINAEHLNIIEKNIRLSETSHIKENIYKESKEKNVNFGKLMQFLRISLVGSLNGPDVFFIIEIIGKNVTLRRFNSLLNKTKKQ